MSQSALTAKYRPQRFADVAGQETIKGILSRAAAEDRIAPAYLFSGTRGVGKTTIARILAKAVNCLQAPVPEPCNQCNHCRQITQGMAVDVIEIDGASNRGIEDARRIREDIGYAPMECRYKVFIIDEAHMLTKEASNALLKTLEEPPGNVAFILATTEPHKILPTIVSRCQHYAFKRLTQPGLLQHLERVLQQENADYDPRALQLIARRAAGSVRDSMSLLGQAMALGRDRLEVEDVRSVLGLAGSEVFFDVLQAVHGQDPLAINALLRELLDQGLDLGFFLRELAQTWRNLFLLSQAGEKALDMLELTDEEGAQWLEWARTFSLQHIHAAWQLTLEGQRRVLTSLEPALALELLLLNLAFLPSLVSMEQVAGPPPTGDGQGKRPQAQRPGPPQGAPTQGAPTQQTPPAAAPGPAQQAAARGAGRQPRTPASGAQGGEETAREDPEPPAAPPEPAADPAAAEPPPGEQAFDPGEDPQARDMPPPPGEHAAPSCPLSWNGFLEYAAARAEGQEAAHLRQVEGVYEDGRLVLRCKSSLQRCKLTEGDYGKWVTRLARDFFGEQVVIEATQPENGLQTRNQSKDELESHPLVQSLQSEMGARILDWGSLEPS